MAAPPPTQRIRIVQAALAAFSGGGIRGTSIQEVADRVGMSRQALMHHFPTKEALRQGVYAMLSERLRALLPVDLNGRPWAEVVAQVTRGLDANPDIARFVAFELLDHPGELTAWLGTELAGWLAPAIGIVGRDQPDGDPQAHVMMLALVMLSVSALMPRAEPQLHQRVLESALEVMQSSQVK